MSPKALALRSMGPFHAPVYQPSKRCPLTSASTPPGSCRRSSRQRSVPTPGWRSHRTHLRGLSSGPRVPGLIQVVVGPLPEHGLRVSSGVMTTLGAEPKSAAPPRWGARHVDGSVPKVVLHASKRMVPRPARGEVAGFSIRRDRRGWGRRADPCRWDRGNGWSGWGLGELLREHPHVVVGSVPAAASLPAVNANSTPTEVKLGSRMLALWSALFMKAELIWAAVVLAAECSSRCSRQPSRT